MKRLLLFFIFGNLFLQGMPQKLAIDSNAIRKWPSLGSPMISNDGAYALYSINNQPSGTNTLVIKSTNTIWEKEVLGASPILFAGDSKQVILKRNDSLIFIRLGTNIETFIDNVKSYKFPELGKGNSFCYLLNNSTKRLILLDLLTSMSREFDDVNDYSFDDKGNVLLVKSESGYVHARENIILWVGISAGADKIIWQSNTISDTCAVIGESAFDITGRQLAFIVQVKEQGQAVNSIWYYNDNMDKAVVKVNNRTQGIGKDLIINDNTPIFSKNGEWIFFGLQKCSDTLKPYLNAVKVDVWNYKDVTLQSAQLNDISSSNGNEIFRAAINSKGIHVIALEYGNVRIQSDLNLVKGYIILTDDSGAIPTSNKYTNQVSYYLFSLEDGSRKFIKKGWDPICSISPFDKYVVYFDKEKKQYFTYEIENNKAYSISHKIPVRVDNEYGDQMPNAYGAVGIAGWLEQDSDLLIYDNYDIWIVDPRAKRSPLNITNGYGASHHLKFTLVCIDDAVKWIRRNEKLLLTAFNTNNKQNGFFRYSPQRQENPELLIMDSAIFYQIPPSGDIIGMRPLKANNRDCWIVMRQTGIEAPNYYLTDDFKKYKSLTHFRPEQAYNWLTAELVKWRQLDGTYSQGILYKPENFNPKMKYPIIFNYYEEFSNTLYQFISPEFISSDINIPLFVSQGYLVFVPDIHFSIAKISGKTNYMSAYNAVVSAAKYLSKFPWVDSKRLGINGHSFAGGITYYLITHTSFFAAAIASAGTSDFISSYLSLTGPLAHPSGSRLSLMETGQGRMGANLWERPNLYLESSSILRVDQVMTPLLIMHNMKDYAVPWGQGVEMFLALQRLRKKVWMLQYDNGDHGVYGKDAEDYTIRFKQFFDHYLKGALPPRWMTEGIRASRKGIDSGIELDKSGSVP